MQTDRIFTGNICLNGNVVKENAILIFCPKRGYLDLELISDSFLYRMATLGKLNEEMMGTTQDKVKKYVDASSIRPFEYNSIQALNEVSIKQLKQVAKSYYEKRDN